jgi:riboflavin biosynthesis pyrimidine reductase
VRWLSPGEHIGDVLEPYRRPRTPPSPDRPWVVANMVCDLAGSTTIEGRVGALSGGTDAVLFRRLRELADVVLVGAETVRRERYGTVRVDPSGVRPQPPIAVVSRSLDFDWTIPMFASPGNARPLLLTATGSDPAARARAADHADVVVAGDDRVDVRAALAALARRGAEVVVCEGGPHLLGELVAADALDELCLSVAPMLGGDPLPVAVIPSGAGLRHFDLVHVAEDEGTLFLRYERRPGVGS